MLLFVIVAVSTIWMHVAIRRMERARHPALAEEKYLSDVPHEPHPAPEIRVRRAAGSASQPAE
jgi:NNP family nitrate/nitrite transporter-like MFS transporter